MNTEDEVRIDYIESSQARRIHGIAYTVSCLAGLPSRPRSITSSLTSGGSFTPKERQLHRTTVKERGAKLRATLSSKAQGMGKLTIEAILEKQEQGFEVEVTEDSEVRRGRKTKPSAELKASERSVKSPIRMTTCEVPWNWEEFLRISDHPLLLGHWRAFPLLLLLLGGMKASILLYYRTSLDAWKTTKREDSIHHWPTLYPHGAIRRVSLLTHPTDQTGKARSGTPETKQAVPVGPNQMEEQLATPEQLQRLCAGSIYLNPRHIGKRKVYFA
ncbi:thiopurine S-methyltransferase [Striga asiatica]|uniref:Thiopurine S-methyltransferase n=1 Tax=Striga asiatica TaxID=4170 RepID=A0A5A7Q1S8_STRAF|nr:thiopurine S-methyltransferase [Striga asiatica]